MPEADPAQPSRPASSAFLACPYCGSYDVGRLYLASVHLDSCECRACAARWDEDVESGEFRGRSETALLVAPTNRTRSQSHP